MVLLMMLPVVLGAVTACSAPSPGGSDKSAIRATGADTSQSVDWQPQGNKNDDETITEAAFQLWDDSRAVKGALSGEQLLYAGDAGIAGIANGECGVVVLAALAQGGGTLVGWFASTGALSPTNLTYLGETPFVVAQQEQSIATTGACQSGGTGTAVALAAPGMRIAPPTPMDLAPGEYGPQAPLAIWTYKASETPEAILTKDGVLQTSFQATPPLHAGTN